MILPNTRRFFVSPAALCGDMVQLEDAALAHQLARVLRLGPGDHVLLLDGLGEACAVELTELSRDAVAGRVTSRGPAGNEPSVALQLYLALMRPERFEWALQKGVELGARRLVPVQFARSLPADRAEAKKLERWRRIVREAAEQSCRGLLPELAAPMPFAAACAEAAALGPAALLYEGEGAHLRDRLREPPAILSLLSGPEGGITPEEVELAAAQGIPPVSLGPRILRAETAPVAAAAMVLYVTEGERASEQEG
jgi:16S rRNA (uracil1498-N3)-methyltransferase